MSRSRRCSTIPGLRTGKNLRFTPRHVAAVRGIYQIFTPRTVAVQDGEISVKQAAQLLGIPADAIYNWLRLGQVPANTRAGRWCIPWDAQTQEIYRQKIANSFRLKPTPAAAGVR
jgi:predicted DNA-binding transcriptional regulator AlpA